MSYCVKCGVELADSEPACPLCGTTVYHPEINRKEGKKPFPVYQKNHEETVSRSGVLFVLSVICLIPLISTLLCDLSLGGGVTWSGYTTGAIIFLYVVAVLPVWFKKPNPVIFVPADFAAAGVYLFYIDFMAKGGWFLSFALPVLGGAALIATALIALMRYVKRGYLYMLGGAFIATGFFAVLIEYLINYTFHVRDVILWSIYPFASCFLIGVALIVIAICKPLRESLHKKFFI